MKHNATSEKILHQCVSIRFEQASKKGSIFQYTGSRNTEASSGHGAKWVGYTVILREYMEFCVIVAAEHIFDIPSRNRKNQNQFEACPTVC